tara:strand:- start:1989 stop:2180 length:192 start_codon:yes stop_codon:yes gene_type:complete
MIYEMDELLKNINECCRKIAERDGFKLPPVGGYVKKPNGYWTFVEGEGEYKLKDGDMQWELKL